MSRLNSQGSVVRWTWIVDSGSAADWELKDWACTGYNREELREHATIGWSEYLVEGRLVVNGLTTSPSFVILYLWIFEGHYPLYESHRLLYYLV